MTRTKKLLALAEAATPGPWIEEGKGSYGTISAPKSGWITRDIIRMDGSTMAAFHQEGNRRFIAAANPETIKQLVKLVRLQHEALKLIEDGSEFSTCIKDEMSYAAYKDVKRMFDAIAAFNKFEGGE